MPYRKRTFAKRGRRVNYSKSKKMVTGHGPTLLEKIASGAGSVAKLAMAVAPAIAAINTESKFYDQTATVISHSPGTNDTFVALSGAIAQGTDEQNRIGNSCLAQDLQLRLAHNFNSTLGAPNVVGIHCRMMLICWKENGQSNVPSVAKVFQQPNNLYSPVNKDNSDQFVVLKDKFFSLNSTTGVAGSTGFTSNKLFKKLNWHLRWADATVTGATQNHVYLLLRSSASGATNALSTTYYSRMNYTDN